MLNLGKWKHVQRQGNQIPHVPPPKRHPYDQWSPDARALDLVGDKWTLLIVRDLVSGPRRFVELQRVLPGISTEQLRSRLNRMVADGMLTRQALPRGPAPRRLRAHRARARAGAGPGRAGSLGLRVGLGPAAPLRAHRPGRDLPAHPRAGALRQRHLGNGRADRLRRPRRRADVLSGHALPRRRDALRGGRRQDRRSAARQHRGLDPRAVTPRRARRAAQRRRPWSRRLAVRAARAEHGREMAHAASLSA